MTAPLDPIPYLRFPKPDVATAITLAKVLLHRVPRGASPMVREAASRVEASVDDLEEKWSEQVVSHARTDLRPVARRLGIAWNAIRDRLVHIVALPEGSADRTLAGELHDMLFADGLEFLRLKSMREHAESERKLRIIDGRGLAQDLARLVGERFLKALRAAHQAFGDALGANKAVPVAPAAVFVAEPLRVLVEAITGYALQLLAVARHDSDKQPAIVVALGPIDEFRASVDRHLVADGDDDDDEQPGDQDDDDDIVVPPASNTNLAVVKPAVA